MVGQVQKGRQRPQRRLRIQLPVLKPDQNAVLVQPVLRVDHEAPVQDSLHHRVAHHRLLLALLLVVRRHRHIVHKPH